MKSKKNNKDSMAKKTRKKRSIPSDNFNRDNIVACRNKSFNNYTTFEDKVEEIFKKKNIDFDSVNYNL